MPVRSRTRAGRCTTPWRASTGVVVELHLSNPDAREPWRRLSVLAPVADGTVAGFGGLGYELAVEAAARLVAGRSRRRPTRSFPRRLASAPMPNGRDVATCPRWTSPAACRAWRSASASSAATACSSPS